MDGELKVFRVRVTAPFNGYQTGDWWSYSKAAEWFSCRAARLAVEMNDWVHHDKLEIVEFDMVEVATHPL